MERLNQMNQQFAGQTAAAGSDKKQSLSVVDNRTGKWMTANSLIS